MMSTTANTGCAFVAYPGVQVYTDVVGENITFGRFVNLDNLDTLTVQYMNNTDGAWYVGAVEPTAYGLILDAGPVDRQFVYSLSWSLISGHVASDNWCVRTEPPW